MARMPFLAICFWWIWRQALVWWCFIFLMVLHLHFFSITKWHQWDLIFDFNKSDLKFDIFLIDPFWATAWIRVYCPACLPKHNSIRSTLAEHSKIILLTVKTHRNMKPSGNLGSIWVNVKHDFFNFEFLINGKNNLFFIKTRNV